MQNEDGLTSAERELQAALGALRPARPGVDRDRVLFRAGRVSARRRGRLWPAASVALAACLGVSLATRPAPHQGPQIVRVQSPAPGPTAPALRPGPTDETALACLPQSWAQGSYAKLLGEVLERGLAALPAPAQTAEPEPPLTLQEVLGTPPPAAGQSQGPHQLLKFFSLGETQ